MALKAVIDTLDGLDETMTSFYKKQDNGKYALSVDGVENLAEMNGLVSTMKKEREARRASEERLKALEEQYKGVDLDQIGSLSGMTKEEAKALKDELKEFKAAQEKQKKQKLKKEEQWEKLEEELRGQQTELIQKTEEKYLSQIESLKTQMSEIDQKKEQEIAKRQQSLEKHLKREGIISSLAKAEGNVTILEPHISPQVQVLEENGEFVNRVVDTKGNVRYSNTGEAMSIDDLVTELSQKPEFQGEGIFKKTRKPGGSGSGGNQDGLDSGEKNPWKKDTWNLTQQALLIRKDPTEAARLKTAAGHK